MKSIKDIKSNILFQESPYVNRRDEMIKIAVQRINDLRKDSRFEKIVETPHNLAKRINQNPFLKGNKNDGELEMVLNHCELKGNYSYLYFLLKQKSSPKVL